MKSIVYGSIAKDIKYQKREDGHTHKWCVYVRPYLDEDMSKWVKKIRFKLHESYDIPTRIVETPPFEITETGWGEFEFTIKIFFVDPNERTVSMYIGTIFFVFSYRQQGLSHFSSVIDKYLPPKNVFNKRLKKLRFSKFFYRNDNIRIV